jgi:peptide chain release factor 1
VFFGFAIFKSKSTMSRLPINEIIEKFNFVNKELAQITDTKKMIELSKKQTRLEPQYVLATNIQKAENSITENTELLKEIEASDEMFELLTLDIEQQKSDLEKYEQQLLSFLTPEDPRDGENILIEIRAGAGGDESALFAADLFKMYSLLADALSFKVNIISVSQNTLGGYKEIIAEIKGNSVYSWYKFESGVHRVQRVPATEKQGRIHTSTASVAIMPLIENDNDFKLNESEIEITFSTSSGKGGQSVNTTYSAVKMIHKPTGIEAQSQDERNQLQNKAKCLAVLTSRVYDHYEEERQAKESAERREQVGRNDRSEKIRTYNFPQDRLTDHRYNQNWNQLPNILTGKIEEVIIDIRKLEAEKALLNLNKN